PPAKGQAIAILCSSRRIPGEDTQMRRPSSSIVLDSPRCAALGLLAGAAAAGLLFAAPPSPGPAGAGGRPAPGVGPGLSGPSRAREADLVLRGGAVYTLDAVRSWAESVAIRKDTILYVGPDSGIAPYVGPRTRVV